MKNLMVLFMSLMVGAAFAASTHLSLDNRTGVRVANGTEQIRFSPAWESETAGAVAVVSINGEVVRTANEEGAFDWTPAQSGTYQLTHTVLVNGVQVGETLSATFVVGVSPRSMDWSSGTIELGWYADAKDLNPITYSVYWSESDQLSSCINNIDHLVGTKTFAPSKVGAQELTISDDQYLTHGDGLKPVYYHVVGTDGSASFCKTRNRYGVVAAIGKYAKGDDGNCWQNDMPNAVKQAESFADEFRETTETKENIIMLTDNMVKKNVFRSSISNFAAKAQSGDVFVLYFESHGGVDEKGRPVIAFYENKSAYLAKDMGADISAFRVGVGFVGILYNCHSAEFADPYADVSKWLEGTGLDVCTKDRAWIAACGAAVSTPQDVFGVFFSELGWKDGWADKTWENGLCAKSDLVSFGALGRYTKQRVHELIAEELESEPEIFDEQGILDNIIAGRRGRHTSESKPSAPTLFASQGEFSDRVVVRWTQSERSKGYMFFRCRTNGDMYIGRSEYKYWYKLLCADVLSFDAENVGYKNDTDTFWVKSFNGAGVVKSNLSEGWLSWTEGKVGNLSFAWTGFDLGVTLLAVGTYENISAFAPGKVVVPQTLGGYDVVGIARSAFNGNTVITDVSIPDVVTTIAADTFAGCVNLSGVTFRGELPNGAITSGIFSHATRVYYPREYAAQYEQVVPPEKFAGYTDDEVRPDGSYTEMVGDYTWYYVVENGAVTIGNWQDDCAPAVDPVPEKMVVPSTLGGCPVVSIREYAFSMVDGLKSVVISEGVRRIEEAAFDRCDDVVELRIPSTVEDMVGDAVYACKALKSIDVSADNAWYRTVDGMVFTKDGRKLVMCPSGITGEVRIPDSVVDIGDSAFNMASITAVAIPNGVTNIGSSAFRYCTELRALVLPSSLKRLGSYSIQGCFELVSLRLPSSVEEIEQYALLQCDMLTVVYVDKGDAERVKGLYDWPSGVEFVEVSLPSVEGDPGATVTSDAETGYVIKPSEGKTAVVVSIPDGIDAGQVTVEVSPKVASVKPNGAKVKIVSGGADIMEFLNVPAVDGNGVVDLTKATVKEEIVKEAMDPVKGAKIELNAANPSLTTPNTRIGLFYQLHEGTTLGGMKDGDSTVGNGEPWSPEITVKGGKSAFFSIGVGKGK